MTKTHYQFSGSLSLEALSYVERKADQDLYKALKSGQYCYIFNSRKMGKSSLSLRLQDKLEKEGYCCCRIDLNWLGTSAKVQEWYYSLIEIIAEKLPLDETSFEEWLEQENQINEIYLLQKFIRYILTHIHESKIIIFIDEIDVVNKLNFSTDDFFAFIRACHEERVTNPIYHRLLFVLIGTATPNQLIKDRQRTPFNIGQAIEIQGIRISDNCQPLTRGLEGKGVPALDILKEILFWTGGQPFLTQKICALIARTPDILDRTFQKKWIEEFIHFSITENWEEHDEPAFLTHIRDRILNYRESIYLLRIYLQILQDKRVIATDNPQHEELLLSGLVVADKQGFLKVANPIYQAIFDRKWVINTMSSGRPYQEELTKWENSNFTDKSCLLQGRKLNLAREWQNDKNLDSIDYRFIAECERRARQRQVKLIKIALTIAISGVSLLGVTLYPSLIFPYLFNYPYIRKPELFSEGEKRLFIGKEDFNKDQGNLAFRKKNYIQAREFFKRATQAIPNNPEAWIYYNNSLAVSTDNFITLAVVIPIGQREENALEILRGVAQAQDQYNRKQIKTNQKLLLNIVIANDSNQPHISQQVAQELIKDQRIIGVIGHNESTATLQALPEYEKAGLPLISPTSTSIFIKGYVFFRALPSDTKSGETLAQYAVKKGVNRVVIFYTPESAYSKSITESFTNSFHDQGGIIVRTVNLQEPLDVSGEVLKMVFIDQADAAILFPSTKVASVVVEMAREMQRLEMTTIANLKNKLLLLGADSLYNSDILLGGGEAIKGLTLVVPWFSDAVVSSKFINEANNMWQGRVSWRTATSYDATQAFIAAISNTQSSTRSEIRQKLEFIRLSADQTSGGDLKFSNQEITRKPVIIRVNISAGGPKGSIVNYELLKDR